jgi:hypothetical protein
MFSSTLFSSPSTTINNADFAVVLLEVSIFSNQFEKETGKVGEAFDLGFERLERALGSLHRLGSCGTNGFAHGLLRQDANPCLSRLPKSQCGRFVIVSLREPNLARAINRNPLRTIQS